MYIAAQAPRLESKKHGNPCLVGVNIEADFEDLLCTTRMTQRYVNPTSRNIEAVYTFPLPLDAVLLDLEVGIGDRRLKGRAVPVSRAQEAYEEAIVEGQKTVMLEKTGTGLYTMNIGNIGPGEHVEIVVVFAELLVWKGERITYTLPLTLAPRYGDPAAAGLKPHQVPTVDSMVKRPFSLRMHLRGLLAEAHLDCPTHDLGEEETANTRVLTLGHAENAMDRDLIVHFSTRPRDYALCSRDHDRYVVLASFVPTLEKDGHREKPQARTVKILVDCSGSMLGDSMTQAREAVFRILDRLEPEDHFCIVRFGSHVDRISGTTSLPASPENIARMVELLETMDADLGGTDLEKGLDATMAVSSPSGMSRDILLITDGEVWETEAICQKARNRGQRIFCVGVGSAVARDALGRISAISGGEAVFVSPAENMEGAICDQFKRMTTAPFQAALLGFGKKRPVEKLPDPLPTIFPGDTVHMFAWFETEPPATCRLQTFVHSGDMRTNEADVVMLPGGSDILARMAARKMIDSGRLSPKQAEEKAVLHNLVTRHTNYLVIDEQGETQEDLPDLVQVPHMLAAGWGGQGRVAREDSSCSYCECAMMDMRMDICSSPSPNIMYSRKKARINSFDSDAGISAFRERFSPQACLEGWNGRFTLAALTLLVSAHVMRNLEELVKMEKDETMIVACFLSVLLDAHQGRALPRQVTRKIRKAMKKYHPGEALMETLRDLVC